MIFCDTCNINIFLRGFLAVRYTRTQSTWHQEEREDLVTRNDHPTRNIHPTRSMEESITLVVKLTRGLTYYPRVVSYRPQSYGLVSIALRAQITAQNLGEKRVHDPPIVSEK